MTGTNNIRTKAYVVAHKGAPFVLTDVVLDEIQEHEVLVEIKYTGICHTDIVVQQGGMPIGAYPAVLGHEGAGIVRQVASGSSLRPGDTVLLSFHSCGRCRFCLDGRLGGCPHMTETNFINTSRSVPGSSPISLPDGKQVHGQFFGQSSLSKMAVVTEKSVIKIDAHIDDLAHLAPLGCGYLTGAGTVINVLKPGTADKLAVFGAGAVGLAAMMAAKALDVKSIIAVDLVDTKLQMATVLGATHTINSGSCRDVHSAIKNLVPNGVDSVVDTTGVTSVIEASVKSLAHGGTLAIVGVPSPTSKLQIDTLEFLTSCKRIVGVIEGLSSPGKLIPQLIQMYREGNFPVDMISKVYPAECLDQAIKDLKSGTVIKPILSWESIDVSL